MKIIRDGKEIELTKEEIMEAGCECERIYRIEDLMNSAELIEIEPDENKRTKLVKDIAPMFEEYLSYSDEYNEAYWKTARWTIRDYMEEKGKCE